LQKLPAGSAKLCFAAPVARSKPCNALGPTGPPGGPAPTSLLQAQSVPVLSSANRPKTCLMPPVAGAMKGCAVVASGATL